jgi:hypothetical protein
MASGGVLQEQEQERLFRVHPVLGLVEHHRLRAFDHLVGHVLTPVAGQTVHKDRVRFRPTHRLLVDLVGGEIDQALFLIG